MANIRSAQKRARQTIKRTARNKARRSSVRTGVRRVEEALAAGDLKAADTALREAESLIARAGRIGSISSKAGSRKVSRLSARIRALKA